MKKFLNNLLENNLNVSKINRNSQFITKFVRIQFCNKRVGNVFNCWKKVIFSENIQIKLLKLKNLKSGLDSIKINNFVKILMNKLVFLFFNFVLKTKHKKIKSNKIFLRENAILLDNLYFKKLDTLSNSLNKIILAKFKYKRLSYLSSMNDTNIDIILRSYFISWNISSRKINKLLLNLDRNKSNYRQILALVLLFY